MTDDYDDGDAEIEFVTLDPRERPRMRVSDMRIISAVTGMTWDQLFNEGDEAARFQILVFWKLRRRHRDMGAAEVWKMAEDFDFELTGGDGPPPVDPTGGVT